MAKRAEAPRERRAFTAEFELEAVRRADERRGFCHIHGGSVG